MLLLDHAPKVAEKIRISGGGRCNFTNRELDPRQPHKHFLGDNPNFCRSALSRYTPADFIELLQRHGIPFHEKHKGQLFCDRSAQDLIELLLKECEAGGVQRWQPCAVQAVSYSDADPSARYQLQTDRGPVSCRSLVVATGGLSIPSMGATGFGYDLAKQFGHDLLPTRAGLVPLTLDREARRLPLTLSAPDKAVPLTRLEVTATSTPNSQGRVVLAAVDRGVLNISDYQPLDPFEIFFGRKRFAQDLFDNYGQVIPPQDGKLARLNYGGDRAPLKKGGALESRVEVAALWSGEVSFDESGKAVIPLDLPNFNGELALMALAWNAQQVGEAERAVKVVAPLVAEIGWPRFGARGDETRALPHFRR